MSPTPLLSRPDISPELVLVDPELRRVALLLLPEPGSFARVAQPKPRPVNDPPQRREPVVARRSRARVWSRRALPAMVAAGALAVMWPSAVGLRTPPGPWLVSADPSALTALQTLSARTENEARRESELDRARVAGASATRERRAKKASSAALVPAKRRPARATHPQRAKTPKPRPAAKKGSSRNAVSVRETRRDRAALSWKAVEGASYYNVIVWRKGQRVLDLWPSVNRTLLPGSWTYGGASRTLSPGRYLWFVYPGFGARADARYGQPVQSGILVVDRK
jgi:hypothetical protein